MANTHKFTITLHDPVTGNFSTDDSYVSTTATAYVTQQGGIKSADPNGEEWTQATLSRTKIAQTASIPQGQSVAFRSVGMHAHFKSAPKITSIAISPSTELSFTEGAENSISWHYSDADGDPQTQWSLKIFDQFTYESTSFSADNSQPVWQQSGSDNSSSISLDTYLPQVTGTKNYNTGFVDGGVYYVAVKAAKDHNKTPFWSDWAFLCFTVFIDQPKPPLLSVYTNSNQASNTLVIQSSDNLLGDNNGGMSQTMGDWRKTNNDTASSALAYGHMATTNTNALTADTVITSLNVGSTGYLATVGGLTASATAGSTFTVSGKRGSLTAATGFPISGTFWVTIGSENILCRNNMDGTTKTPDTFTIVARNYNPYTQASGAGTAHAQWSPVVIGLQSDIYAGSIGELVFTYDITVYGKPVAHPGKTRWVTTDPGVTSSTGGQAAGQYALSVDHAIDPNNKNERNHFWVKDPNGHLKAGMKVQIKYQKFQRSVAKLSVTSANGTATGVKSTKHIESFDPKGAQAETVTIKSVDTTTTTETAYLFLGTTTGSRAGGPGSLVKHVDLHLDANFWSGTNNVTGTVDKNQQLIFEAPNGKRVIVNVTSLVNIDKTSKPGNWADTWKKITIPVNFPAVCKEFSVNGSNGKYFVIPDGTKVYQKAVQKTNPVRRVNLTQDYGQGQFRGVILSKGDQVLYNQVAKAPTYTTVGAKGYSIPGKTTYTTPSWQEARTALMPFTVGLLPSKPLVYFGNITLPTSGGTFPLFNSLTVNAPQFNCSITSGSSTISALSNSDAASLSVGITISSTAFAGGNTTVTSVNITPTGNSIGVSSSATATSASSQITVSVGANAYQNYTVEMNGVPIDTVITSNTASTGTTFTINLSASGSVPVNNFDGSNNPSYNTVGSATFYPPNAHVIPAGSTSIPLLPCIVNFPYPIQCPVRINYPALFGDNAVFVKPLAAGSTNTADVSLVKSANVGWTATNNVPVIAGQRYGLMGFSRRVVGSGTPAFTPYIDWYNEVGDLLASSLGRHSITTPYFTGNLNGTTTISGISTTNGLDVGNYLSGQGIPSGTYIVSIGSNSLVMSNAATITQNNVTISNSTTLLPGAPITFTGTTSTASTTMTSVSSTTGLLVGQYINGYGLASSTTIAAIGSGQITLSATPTAANAGGAFRVASTGLLLGEVGATFYYSPNSQNGQNWTPNGITGIAPSAHVIASVASFTLTTGTIGTYSVPAGTTTTLSAGAVITDGNGFTTTLTQTASAGSTSLTVRFNTQPSGGNTGLFASATRAVPRFQWINAIANDVYALSSVMFRSMTANLPNSNYTALNTQLDTLQKPVSQPTQGYSSNAIVLSSTTKTNGSATVFILDPSLDNGTREIVQGANSQILWTNLTASASAGATSISLSNVNGLASGGTAVIGFGTPYAETVTVATNWNGANPLLLDPSTPLYYNHPLNDTVYAYTIAIASGVAQPQTAGTPVAVFDWNTDGWINTPKAHYGLAVQRSEDNGKTWATLRNGGNISVNSQGVATITDYEITPGAQQLYRSWATWISPSAQQWQGEPTGSLVAPVMANTQWWISSTSNPALRYPLLVQNQFTETQKHTSGVMYPLGSRYPITIAGVVGGRDGSIDVMWTDLANWQNFLDFLRLGETYVLLSPVENKKFYIFINQDVTWENNAASQPYRKVTIPYVEAAPPNYGYTYGN